MLIPQEHRHDFTKLTHLQFLLIDEMLSRFRSGKELRDKLAQEGHRKSAAAFYQMMARLEDASFVKGSYRERRIDGQLIRERFYKVVHQGRCSHP